MMYIDLVLNLSLLVALSSVSGFIEKRLPRRPLASQLMQGLLFGGAAVLGMLRPLHLEPGLILDGRSVMVSLCAMIFGPLAGSAAGAITIFCRLLLGGMGTLTGVLVILSSLGIGLIFHSRVKTSAEPPSVRMLFGFGAAVHLAMLALMLTLPGGAGPAVLKRIGLPVILLYPLATVLSGKVLADQLESERRLAALRESEKLYRLLVETANEGIWSMDGDHHTTYVNRAMAAMLGYTPEEMLGKPVEAFFFSEDMAFHEQRMQQRHAGADEIYERRFRRRDGSPLWTMVAAKARQDPDGRFAGSFAMFTDITAHKTAEESLKAGRAELHALLDAVKESVFLMETDGTIVALNQTTAVRLGSNAEDMIGQNMFDILPPDVARRRRAYVEQVIADGKPVRFEDQRNGMWIDNSIYPVTDESGRVMRLAIYGHDITERKMSEQALMESKRLLDATQQLAKIGGWEWDTERRTMTWTDETYRIHDLAPGRFQPGAPEHIQRSLECYDAADRPMIDEAFRLCVEEGRAYNLELPFTDASGRRIWIQTSARPVMKDRRVVKVIGNLMDITERKNAERELRESEHKFSRIFKSNAALMAISTLQEGRFIDVNDEFLRVLGFGYDEVVGKSSLELGFFAHTAQRTTLVDLIREKEQLHNIEIDMRTRSGEIRRGLFSGSIIHLKDQECWLTVLKDITARMQAEESLRLSEKTHRALIQGIPDIVMRFDQQGRHLFVSENVMKLTGIQAAAFIGKTHRELGFPEEQSRYWEDCIRKVFRDGEMVETEFTYEGINGQSVFNWRLIPEFDTSEKVSSVLSLSRDITLHRRAEQNYETLFREMMDGFALHEIIHDSQNRPADYRFLAVNPAFERLTGLAAREIVGKTVLEIMPETERHWIDIYGQVAMTGESIFFENYSKVLNKYFEVSAFRPGPDQFACIFADITDRKAIQEQRERQLTFSRALNKISEFTIANDNPDAILEISNRIIGEALCADRMLIYDISFAENRITALCEWLGQPHREIAATKGEYTSLEMFREAFEEIRDTKRYLESHVDAVNAHFLENGSDRILHDQLHIKSLIWYPFAFDDHGYYLFTINRILQRKIWNKDELDFLRSVANLVTIALMKIRMLGERRRVEEELAKQKNQLQKIFEILPIGLWIADKHGNLLRGNAMGVKIWGAEPHVSISEYGIFKAWRLPSREPIAGDDWALAKTIRDGVTIMDELLEIEAFDGKRKTILNYTAPVLDADGGIAGAIVLNLDISDRKALENQLLQSQKMESVGRLAGGVAHDFNNMLMIIIGNAEMALDETEPSAPLAAHLQEIMASARRSADLTRQLLAFARKQTVSPRVLDLNEVVSGMIKMLQRLIGEDIDLVWKPSSRLWPVNMDPSQIDQILVNLAVNARDAITGVGNLTIETENAVFDETDCMAHAGLIPGEYVRLSVSDTGCGMGQETIEHLFEPFYTTKEVGKGTGLGLATVYGIVRQNDGFIHVHSEPGHGTTFKIHIPRTQAAAETAPQESGRKPAGGTETVLLVEDEPAILKLAQAILERYGYTVLAARTPREAREIAGSHPDPIHLLITDVVMPQMNGRDLLESIATLRPEIRVLFMSGYTADVIAHHGVLDEGIHFLQKPFSVRTLSAKVRDVLNGKDA
ncbi:MAG: PAS domain S-box protein [Thermodesulfobacteriota bacterium]